MTALATPPIEIDCEVVVRTAQCLGERVFVSRQRDQVDTIRHQTIAEKIEIPALRVGPQQHQIQAPVGIGEEDFLAVIPPLRDVLRYAHRNHASGAWHDSYYATTSLVLSKNT